ncbi:MAG: DUF2132 domain-containing protein [Nitrospirae bacterium]|nr:DUF2132 domain-containing protein [Nitrospirota bacterium]
MTDRQVNDPLHGVTLEMMLTHLVEHYGWEEMSRLIRIRCFSYDPSIKSSLTFLRKTPWARKKVENLYLRQKRIRIKKKNISKETDI